MGKIHELLAVKKDVVQRAGEIQKETTTVFGTAHLFSGALKTYSPFEESNQTAEADEFVPLPYTVQEKVSWFAENFGRMIDVEWQLEHSNSKAVANLDLISGTSQLSFTDVPAAFLLDLIAYIERIRSVLRKMPVLDPKTVWNSDPDHAKLGAYVSDTPEVTYRTKKTLHSQELAAATDKHPAQIETWHEDDRIGEYKKTLWSGAITARQKSEILDRLTLLGEAAKKALSAANSTEHMEAKVADKIMQFILGDLV